MSSSNKPAAQKVPISIDRARWWALTNPATVFYGSLAAHLVDVMDSSIETAATDGKRILWNPDFVASLTDEEVRFVLLHEALHCAHAHFDRLPLTTEGNIAGDYAINLLLEKISGLKMPKGGLLDKKYANMAEEEILAAVQSPPKPKGGNGKQPQGGGNGKPQQGGGSGGGNGKPQQGQGDTDAGRCGGFIAPDKTPNAGGQTLKEKWEQAVIQADFAARSLGRGDVPADMQRILERVRATDIDWRREMADFARSVVSDRADWSRSTRRMATQPVIYPRRMRDRVGTIVVARDTSGSIDNALCADFSAQVTVLTAELNCTTVVIDCDTRIHAEYRLEAGDECPTDARGGGGTSFDPVFNRVAELIDSGEQVAGVIYLTDLDGSFPDIDAVPTVPILWAAYNTSSVAPFGRTIHVKR